MTRHAFERVARGQEMLGVFVIAEDMSIGQAVRELELVALVSDPDEWRSRVIFLPL